MMNQINQHNAGDVIQSLARTINKKLIKPQEEKIICIDERAQFNEEELNRQLNELEEKLEDLRIAHKRMGFMCISLSLAVIIVIIIQVI